MLISGGWRPQQPQSSAYPDHRTLCLGTTGDPLPTTTRDEEAADVAGGGGDPEAFGGDEANAPGSL